MNVGAGVIEGGWSFIWAAYVATWVFFVSYGVSLYLRRPPPTLDKKVSP